MVEYDIHDPIFSANEFWESRGATKRLRLDETNALLEKRDRGEKILVGDASAHDIVEQLLKRAGVSGHRLFAQLHDAFAEAILRVAGDEPYLWVNPIADFPARSTAAKGLGFSDDDGVLGGPNFSHLPDGYPKPTAEEAEATRKAQEKATVEETERAKLVADTKAGHAVPEKTSGRGRRAASGKPDGDKEDPELKKLLGDGEGK